MSDEVRQKSSSLVALLLLMVGGCAAEPFIRPPLPILTDPNPSALRELFRQSISQQFTSDDRVIIKAPFRDAMAVLAVLHVDRSSGTYELIGLHHMGVELFKLESASQSITEWSAIPPMMDQPMVLQSIGEDTRRIYFDLVPPESAKVEIRSTTIRFNQDTPEGKLVYEFGGQPFVLLEKRLDGFFGYKWRVRYYDYVATAAGAYPRGIVMDNGKYYYRVIVKNRTWTTE